MQVKERKNVKRKTKILVIALLAVIALGAGVACWILAGPFGVPTLVTVNGEGIPVSRFHDELAKIEPAYRDLLKEEPGQLLDGMVNQVLLLQQAKKEGVSAAKGEDSTTPVKVDKDQATIRAFLEKRMAALPAITPQEVESIYETYKSQFAGQAKEAVAPLIRETLERQRQMEAIQKLIADLRQSAVIELNQKEYAKLSAPAPGSETQSEADFGRALTGGKPLVVDFGSNTCIPCRQLRPVLQTIRQSYAGKLEVLVIDIQKNEKLAREYQIQVIPTVIFFDRSGKEVFRHQGFMSEDRIKEQIAKMGVG